MSFLFKSSKKSISGPTPGAALSLNREARTSEGGVSSSQPPSSQIPTLNGSSTVTSKPTSPVYARSASANASISSITERERASLSQRPVDDRLVSLKEEGSRNGGPPSPEQKSLRDNSGDVGRESRLPVQTRPPGDASPYPWSQRRIAFTGSHTIPFPRYGAAVNAIASKDGFIYLMGGLINGSTVKGDLWMVESSSPGMTCYPVATTSEGPGPRVGHASLLVGNAFIVFGGDTKMDEGDMLDDTLYLLNTSTKQWSRALPAGLRPPGRYGHTLNILGSKIYIFGGQVEGYFFNDLVAFDLNALQQPTNRWEILIQNTIDGGPPHGQIPPARTNHTMITWGDRLYLFGGTDGVHWFNDVWSFSPHSNSWSQLECIGYIPSPREGHAAALVGDVMYIFGGRNEEGNDLGDLAAFRISSRRWYTFQNMGPSPSPRSGHSMTTVGKQIVVLAGEPSSAPRDPVELGMAYFLDTTKIRYPPDSASQSATSTDRAQPSRLPNGERPLGGQIRGPSSRDALQRSGSNEGRIRSPDGSRLPRAQPQLPAPSGPPPPRAPPGHPNAAGALRQQRTRTPDRAFSPTTEDERLKRYEKTNSNTVENALQLSAHHDGPLPTSPQFHDDPPVHTETEEQTTQKPDTYQASQTQPLDPHARTSSRAQTRRLEGDLFAQATPRPSEDTQHDSSLQARAFSEESYALQDSGIGSSPAFNQQSDDIVRELEQARKQNAWYASELALARKAGYQARSTESPRFEERAHDSFADDDRPLVEALLNMRSELSRVQDSIEEQSKHAAEEIAKVEKQRDAAINEAAFAKAKLASQGTASPHPGQDSPVDRSQDVSRRLASSLAAQAELTRRVDGLVKQIESEQRAREAAEDTADAAQKRVAELDGYRQEHSAEIESLRTELHVVRKEARDTLANYAALSAQHQLLTVDKDELTTKLAQVTIDSESHASALTSLRDALTASVQKAELHGRQLEDEAAAKTELGRRLRDMKTQYDQQCDELESATKRLHNAQDLCAKHAEEARTHREAVIAGFDKISERGVNAPNVNGERITILQQQAEAANAMVRQHQAAADLASEKLRSAEERIAGLEAYQEQASREGLSIRKQLQATMKENQCLGVEKAELQQKLERHMLETNALSVQHASLKEILSERGINASDMRRSRVLDSPLPARFGTPELTRMRELEQQVESQSKGQEEFKAQLEDVLERADKSRREYEEKLTAMDNDYQATVKYLRAAEKMLSKMKQQLNRVRNENVELKKKVGESIEVVGDAGKEGEITGKTDPAAMKHMLAEWEAEKQKMKEEFTASQSTFQSSVSEMEARMKTIQEQLQTTATELHQTKSSQAFAQAHVSALQTSLSHSRNDIERMQKENNLLEQRARDAEKKVQLLLDQVESSVDNYRRQSRGSTTQNQTVNDGSSGGVGTSGSGGGGANGSVRLRGVSVSEDSDASDVLGSHFRNVSGTSAGGESNYSGGASNNADTDDGRNSLALDSLASELDALRTHWEATNKSYRLSDRVDFDRTPTLAFPAGTGGLADWRRGLSLDYDDDHTRPATQESIVQDGGHADTAQTSSLAGATTQKQSTDQKVTSGSEK